MTHRPFIRTASLLFVVVALFSLGVLSRPALTRIKAELTNRAVGDQHAIVSPKVDPLYEARDSKEYLASFCALAKVQWPQNRTLTIVCHGHSVPAGYFKTPEVQTFQAYPHLLHGALSARFPFAVINVIVTAIGGEASPSGAERLERDVLSLRPDIVPSITDLMIGASDSKPLEAHGLQ